MNISVDYIAVVAPEKKATNPEDFETVEVQEESTFRGVVYEVSSTPAYIGNHRISVGDHVLFARYSPNTHDIVYNGKKIKFIKVSDILAVL